MSLGVLAAAAAAALSVTAGLPPAADPGSASSCAWRLAAVRLYQELAGVQDSRAVQLRALLGESGAGRADFVPEQCRSGPGNAGPSGANDAPPASGPGAGSPGSSTGTGSTGPGTTAAERYGWGQPNRVDEFTDASSLQNWSIYDGPGHAGNGRRTPNAAAIADGLLTITGDAAGNTAGMAWNPGQKYGRWEARVKSPASAPAYHSLLLLWPDAENFPVGGEIDFMEIGDHARQTIDMFLHHGADNSQVNGKVQIDATQWHSWALEWTPQKITAFVDGQEWWSTTDTSIFPPGPMHLCIQLDYFPGDGSAQGGGQQLVDWVKQYPLDGDSSAGSSSNGNSVPGSSTSPGSSSGSSSSGAGSSPGAAGPPGSSPGGPASSGS